MASLKHLAKDTAIYGLSSIIGRFLNYLLVPIYTHVIASNTGGYGVITGVYAQTALMLVILTFGMETTFFRFANRTDCAEPRRVFSTCLIMVSAVAAVFLGLTLTFLPSIATALAYGDHPEYIGMMAIVVAIDAFQAILFSYLRYQKRPIKFAALKLLFIFANILLNLLFFVVLPRWAGWVVDVFWAFAANLICTASITLFFLPELRDLRFGFDRTLCRAMLRYTWPMLVLGIAGILNQTADKIIYPLIDTSASAKAQLGIYGAAVKIAMIMAMITQAFRYAYEPFVFSAAKDSDETAKRATYAKAMLYFVAFTLLAFTCVIAYLDVLRYLISPDYWDGLRVVPIVMAAEIMMGIYFNLSFWYKLTDRTLWGAWFSIAGCLVLLSVNILFIPTYGYMACAWAGVAGYTTCMLLSYFVGQYYYPIRYPLGKIFIYVALTVLCCGAMTIFVHFIESFALRIAFNTVCVAAFLAHICYHELPELTARLLARMRHQ